MNALNVPVEMISTCSAEGDVCPVRFRVRGRDGELHTVRIRRVRDTVEIPYFGIETFRFVCTAEIAGRERLFELRYNVRCHRWVLWQFLDSRGA